MYRKSPQLALLVAGCLLVVGLQGSCSQDAQSSDVRRGSGGAGLPSPELPVEPRSRGL
jgi:hypothetical protein